MKKVIVRMWTADGYHKDVAILSEQQVHMTCGEMDCRGIHMIHPLNAVRIVVDPKEFPEAIEFEVIVERD